MRAMIGLLLLAAAPEHVGNVFLSPDAVEIAAPAGTAKWDIADDAGKSVADGVGRTIAAKLGIGWYRIAFEDAQGKETGYTTAAVLAPLAAPTPDDSPICLDAASAWFARDNETKQAQFARLAKLAGANWVRDRMGWENVEPDRGVFRDHTSYDTSAAVQAKAGLKILQVFHSTPKWAIDSKLDGFMAEKRFPRDLRDEHAFCQAMAQRYKGEVRAWEPWNEANIPNFGGQAIDEMCSLQKAAYWGLKKGNPGIIVSWNVFAGAGDAMESEGVIKNEAWPYFETYNVHTYEPPSEYERGGAHARNAACGRPIWLTECGIGLNAMKASEHGDLSPEFEHAQAAFIAQSYASSLFAGVSRHFFFILGNYLENGHEFGILRYDQTPRPGYVAYAAVGRLLAGARPLGRLPQHTTGACVYAFAARPDGDERDVLVAWSKDPMPNPLPTDIKPLGVYDYLGRETKMPEQVSENAIFVVLKKGETSPMELEQPPALAPRREGDPSPVVMQLVMPASASEIKEHGHIVRAGEDTVLPVMLYNFSDKPVEGKVEIQEAPSNWKVVTDKKNLTVAPGDRVPNSVTVNVPANEHGWVIVRGNFGSAGNPVLAFRLRA